MASSQDGKRFPLARPTRLGAPLKRSRPLVGTFEENILNNRLEPIRTVEGYVADVRASCNSKQPNPMRSGVRVSFYSVDGCFPYLGQVNLGQRGYKIPKRGTLQVSLFNPNGTLVKLFLLHYDLADMPANSQTFLRQKTLFLPSPTKSATTTTSSSNSDETQTSATHKMGTDPSQRPPLARTVVSNVLRDKMTCKNSQQQHHHSSSHSLQQHSGKSRLKYLIQLNIVSSKSGRIYLNKDLRIFVSKKVDLETASQFAKQSYELKAFDEMPSNPKYFSR